MVERTHIDLELKNIKERVNKYKSDNETLTEEIKKAFETTEYF